MSSEMNHNINGNLVGTTDDLSDQLDRALRPVPIAMPKEFEAQVAKLVAPQVRSTATSALSQPVVMRIGPSREAAWKWMGGLIAAAACVACAILVLRPTARNGPPMIHVYVPDPNRQWSNDLWDRGDTLGELRHQYADPAAELWLGREVYEVNVDAAHDDIPRIFDAPRRGIPLSDSARQLGLE